MNNKVAYIEDYSKKNSVENDKEALRIQLRREMRQKFNFGGLKDEPISTEIQ